jgi:hypothetical protein
MSKVILTRYLYIFDEVALAFIQSTLEKSSLNECYFWISELYLSGFHQQTWELIWFIYFDFYFINNPYFTSFIQKKYKEHSFQSILSVVKNMYKLIPSSQIFITRQYNSQIKKIDYIFRGKKPNWLNSEHTSQYHGLIRFLHKKLFHYAVSSLPDQVDESLWKSIEVYYKLDLNTLTLLEKEFYACTYDNPIHKVWSIVCLLEFNRDFISKKRKMMYISISTNELEEINKIHNSPISLSKYNNPQIYKTLYYKRLFSIPKNISSFYLTREHVENINHLIWYHWEYYAYSCPLWKERFDKYKIKINDEKQKIEFEDDDELEEFYSQWGYEPDEQSQETINKRMFKMEENNWKKWYENIFGKDCIFEFPEDFRFSY